MNADQNNLFFLVQEVQNRFRRKNVRVKKDAKKHKFWMCGIEIPNKKKERKYLRRKKPPPKKKEEILNSWLIENFPSFSQYHSIFISKKIITESMFLKEKPTSKELENMMADLEIYKSKYEKDKVEEPINWQDGQEKTTQQDLDAEDPKTTQYEENFGQQKIRMENYYIPNWNISDEE